MVAGNPARLPVAAAGAAPCYHGARGASRGARERQGAGAMETDDALALGLLLRAQRERRGLTQEVLAERAGAGLSVRTISNIERGHTRPYRHTLEVLAGALGLGAAERAALLAAWRARPAPPSAAAPGVPAALTPLLGREREEAAVAHLLRRREVRLLTLTGPGGVGKTRLAYQVAADIHAAFADGVVTVDLAPIRDPQLVMPAVARALGLREAGRLSLREQLAAHLRAKRLLLVLDNMEQVAAAGPALAEVLAACPGLTALVTSRAALRGRGEHVVAGPPLDVPDPTRVRDLQALAQVPAVALFVQRAQEVRPDFALTSTNAAAVAAICARLDGLPLALELAAARLTLFLPQALLARLEGAPSNAPMTRDPTLQVLVSGARDLPERQRTLRDTLAWSYDLLAPQEQTLVRRLVVFAGGCTPEAAEAVCLLDGEAPLAVLAGLIALVDHSLLRQDVVADADEARLVMLETVREYGWERLAASGEAAAVQRAHAAYYLGLAEEAAPELEGPEQAAWMARLEREHANLRAALQWTLAHSGPAEPALEGSM